MELAPNGVKVATRNPGAYQTGFNKGMVYSMWHWFDPKVNFTNTEALNGFNNIQQYDLKELVQAMIDLIVTYESPRFPVALVHSVLQIWRLSGQRQHHQLDFGDHY